MGRHKLEKTIIREIAEKADKEPDMVNHPPHYQSGNGLEVIDIIDGFGLDYYRGNAIKYILRSSKKGNCDEDIKKAIWYLKRFITVRKSQSDYRSKLGKGELEMS